MSKPNLFIVGAPKAGTTFLYTALMNHPQVFFPKNKEPNHFASKELSKNSYYHDYRIEDRQKYLKFFSSVKNEKYIVDGSVSNFAFASIPKKIHDFNPDAKIVIAIRNPIKRAFSHYLMDKRMGHATESFLDYIQKPKNDPHYIQYVQNSMYYENTSHFLKYFAAENIHIVLLEQLDNELEKLYSFLDISSDKGTFDTDSRVNENKQPRNFIARYFQKNRRIATIIKFIVPTKIISKLNRLLYKKATKEYIDDTSANFLYTCFEHDIEKMSNFLKLDLKEIWELNSFDHE